MDISTSGTSLRSMVLTLSTFSCLTTTIHEYVSSRFLEESSSGDRESLANSALTSCAHSIETTSIPAVRRVCASKLATRTSHFELLDLVAKAGYEEYGVWLTRLVLKIPNVSSSAFFRNDFPPAFGSRASFSHAKLKPTA